MLKENIRNLKGKKLISASEFSIVYELDDGRIFKKFSPIMLNLMAYCNVDIQARINSAKPIKNVPEILIPISSVYENGLFIGYTMAKAKGVMLSGNDLGASLEEVNDLDGITRRFLSLEDVVKRANEKDIVFPDFLTLENIFIDENDNYQFIDYEGIQIGKDFVMQLSDGLGSQSQ